MSQLWAFRFQLYDKLVRNRSVVGRCIVTSYNDAGRAFFQAIQINVFHRFVKLIKTHVFPQGPVIAYPGQRIAHAGKPQK